MKDFLKNLKNSPLLLNAISIILAVLAVLITIYDTKISASIMVHRRIEALNTFFIGAAVFLIGFKIVRSKKDRTGYLIIAIAAASVLMSLILLFSTIKILS